MITGVLGRWHPAGNQAILVDRSSTGGRIEGFRKSEFEIGESKRVTIKLDRRAFSFDDVAKKDWSAAAGSFTILVGGSSDKIELQDSFVLTR